jgi:hypothetical protein
MAQCQELKVLICAPAEAAGKHISDMQGAPFQKIAEVSGYTEFCGDHDAHRFPYSRKLPH